jgi:hypothetical protein
MPNLIGCHMNVCADGMVPYPTRFPSLVAARAARLPHGTRLCGFTTSPDMNSAEAWLRRAVEGRLFRGPRLVVSGRSLRQTGGQGDLRKPADGCPACARRAEALPAAELLRSPTVIAAAVIRLADGSAMWRTASSPAFWTAIRCPTCRGGRRSARTSL